jgi:Flp pilus assembly protein TadG
MAGPAKMPDQHAAGGASDGALAMNRRAGKPGSPLARRWLSRLPVRLPGRLLKRSHGTAAVELALIAPMLLTLFAGIIDFARVFDQEIALSGVVASAAQYALLNVASINSSSAASLAATLSGIVANSNGAAWAGATVSVNGGATSTVASGSTTSSGTAANANSCWCPTGASSAAWAFGTAATCGSACTGGTLAGKFVTITGTRAFSAIFGNFGLISNRTLHQSAIVQAQ